MTSLPPPPPPPPPLVDLQMIPLCLRAMDIGQPLSRTVSTFIIQKILMDETGLKYVCMNGDRFFSIHKVLALMLVNLQSTPCSRLYKHIIRCYLRLTDNPRATEAMRAPLADVPFVDYLCHPALLEGSLPMEDLTTRRWLVSLLQNIGANEHAMRI